MAGAYGGDDCRKAMRASDSIVLAAGRERDFSFPPGGGEICGWRPRRSDFQVPFRDDPVWAKPERAFCDFAADEPETNEP